MELEALQICAPPLLEVRERRLRMRGEPLLSNFQLVDPFLQATPESEMLCQPIEVTCWTLIANKMSCLELAWRQSYKTKNNCITLSKNTALIAIELGRASAASSGTPAVLRNCANLSSASSSSTLMTSGSSLSSTSEPVSSPQRELG